MAYIFGIFLRLSIFHLLLLSELSSSITNVNKITIKKREKIKTFTQDDLLAGRLLEVVEIPHDETYHGHKSTLKGIKISYLFEGIKVENQSTIVFKTLDGFSAPISSKRILNTDPSRSIAYLAIEPKMKKWQMIGKGTTVGPFRLVWRNPELSSIGKEEWPFLLSSFEVLETGEELHPAIIPKNIDVKNKKSIMLGFSEFKKNCFACHKLNHEGFSSIGPDLNLPMSPIEYFKADALKKFIRSPKSVRTWNESRMPGFNEKALSDEKIDQLISYFTHMAKSRK